ncbi:MAG: hypothetical protein FWE22_00990 [Firmicutes bacterium]|nr:hypothetical protein [Bacillota bacterium]
MDVNQKWWNISNVPTSKAVQLFLLILAIVLTVTTIILPIFALNTEQNQNPPTNYEITYGRAEWWHRVFGTYTDGAGFGFSIVDDGRDFRIQNVIMQNSSVRNRLRDANLQAGDFVRIKHTRGGGLVSFEDVWHLEVNGETLLSLEEVIFIRSRNNNGLVLISTVVAGIISIICYVSFIRNIIKKRKYKKQLLQRSSE